MFKDFIKHLFPRVVLKKNLRLSYTFCLGGLAFTALLSLLLSGALLLFHYQPVPERAYASILALERDVWGGSYIRNLHRFSSHLFLVFIFLHTVRVLLTGAYQRPRHFNWLIGCALMLLSVFSGYTGYLLPLDQLAYWATQTGMELFRSLPLGNFLYGVLVPDQVGGVSSLLRFYILHITILPMLIMGLSGLHFYRVRKNRGVLPYL
ncbi:cytochrome b N-terminal domain-containing protein [Geobacter pelophilus]|uniref:Cytochrome b N-terminal domain-containing protein n=1 Tax=Geoanaerobacter pelophilus TaxID=60036 RepID=A0AAW4L804_9BACT|nr:cytochrome b N-terminal domain-containing protein [Geoanaerobacter pelophilus]MBT0664431.1 cytochrome b N-terminal domain-containing protein [Geoanaerobacter pelophilus]